MKTNEYKGITLITLVVTVVLLLVLAGVTIVGVISDNGIISKTENMSKISNKAQLITTISMEILKNEIDTDITDSIMKSILEKYGEVQYDGDGNITGLWATDLGEEIDIAELYSGKIATFWYYVDNRNVSNGKITLAIGDYINYDPGNDGEYTSEEEKNGFADQIFYVGAYGGAWRVLGVDESTGELLIISDVIYSDTEDTDGCYYLQGEAGYANCLTELNNICKMYGYGDGATGARSVTVEDINKITGFDPDNVAEEYAADFVGTGEVYEYGATVSVYWNGDDTPYYKTAKNSEGYISLDGELTASYSDGFYYFNEATNTWKKSKVSETATESGRELITTIENNWYYYDTDVYNAGESDTAAFSMLIEDTGARSRVLVSIPLCDVGHALPGMWMPRCVRLLRRRIEPLYRRRK